MSKICLCRDFSLLMMARCSTVLCYFQEAAMASLPHSQLAILILFWNFGKHEDGNTTLLSVSVYCISTRSSRFEVLLSPASPLMYMAPAISEQHSNEESMFIINEEIRSQ